MNDWKEQFLASGIKNVSGSSRLLRKLEPIETEYQMDFAEFSDRQIVSQTIGMITSNMLSNVKAAVTILNKYCDWCLKQGLVNVNIMEGLQAENIDKTEKIRQTMFQNASDFQMFLDTERPLAKPDDFSAMYIAYFWLIWMGCLPKECSELKKQDIQLQQGFLINHQNIVHIVEESQYPLYCALNLKQGEWAGSGGYVDAIHSPYLLVNSVGRLDPKKLDDIDRRYSNRFHSQQIIWQDVFLSGWFDRIQRVEPKDLEKTYVEIGYRLSEAKTKQVNQRLHHEKIRDIKWLHHQWKKAFNQ